MKTFKLLLFAVAVALTAVSCSEDDAINVTGNTFETTYAKATFAMDGMSTSIEYKTKDELIEGEVYFKVEFKENGDLYYYEIADDSWYKTGTYTQSGSEITITEGNESFKATVDGSKIIVKQNIEDEEFPDLSGTMEIHLSKI